MIVKLIPEKMSYRVQKNQITDRQNERANKREDP